MDTTKVFELSSDAKPVTRRSQKKSFGSSEICDILKACYDTKVTRFSFEGLTVDFKGLDQPTLNNQVQISRDKINSQSEAKDKLSELDRTVAEQLDLLEIEDPYAAERFALDEQSVAERSAVAETEQGDW